MDVDMRIGVSIGVDSGSVIISDLIGLRKWQFEIWSRDVTDNVIIANHMEQSGIAG